MTAVELPGSRAGVCRRARARAPDPATAHEVVFHLRPRPVSGGLGWVNREASLPPARRRALSWSGYAAEYGAAEDDLAIVRAFAVANKLFVVDEDPARRRVVVSATAGALERAFGTRLQVHSEGSAAPHLAHEGTLWVTPGARTVTLSVSGLDGCTELRWPSATGRPAVGQSKGATAALSTRGLLGIPDGFDGQDRVVAVLDPGPGAQAVELQAVADVIAAASPNARVDMHRGGPAMADGVMRALSGGQAPTVLLIVGGAPETEWSGAAIRTLEHLFLSAAAMGVAVVATCPPHGPAWFPSSSPHVIATSAGARHPGSFAPVASAVFPVPSWQEASRPESAAGRLMPDLALPVTMGSQNMAPEVIAAAWTAGTIAALPAVATPPGLLMPLVAAASGRRGSRSRGGPLFDVLLSAVSRAEDGAERAGAAEADAGPSPLHELPHSDRK